MAPSVHPRMAFASKDDLAFFFAGMPNTAWHPATPISGTENPFLDPPSSGSSDGSSGASSDSSFISAPRNASRSSAPNTPPIRSNYNFSGEEKEFLLLYPIVGKIAMRRALNRGEDICDVFDRQHKEYEALMITKQQYKQARLVPFSPHTIAKRMQSTFQRAREANLSRQTNMQRKVNDPPLLSHFWEGDGTSYLFELEYPVASHIARRRVDARDEEWRDVWNRQVHQFGVEDCQKYGPLADIDVTFGEINWQGSRSYRVSEQVSPRTVRGVKKVRRLTPPPVPPRPVNRKTGAQFLTLADVVANAEKRKGSEAEGAPGLKKIAWRDDSQQNKERAARESTLEDLMMVGHDDVPPVAPSDEIGSGWLKMAADALQKFLRS